MGGADNSLKELEPKVRELIRRGSTGKSEDDFIGNSKAGDAKSYLNIILNKIVVFKTEIEKNKGKQDKSEVDVTQKASRPADDVDRLKDLPLLKEKPLLPAGNYPLCIKPPQSWSTSGWGLVPVKTLKVP